MIKDDGMDEGNERKLGWEAERVEPEDPSREKHQPLASFGEVTKPEKSWETNLQQEKIQGGLQSLPPRQGIDAVFSFHQFKYS